MIDCTIFPKDKYFLIKVSSSYDVNVIMFDSPYLELKTLQDLLNNAHIEIVRCAPVGLVAPSFALIIDDEGKLKHLPINQFGSDLYANPFDCIVGDILIGTLDEPLPTDEPDVFGLNWGQLFAFCNKFDL